MSSLERTSTRPRDLPSLVWFWLPVPLVVLALGLGAYARNSEPPFSAAWHARVAWYESWFHGETGIVELVTLVVLLAALGAGLLALRTPARFPSPWIRRWLVVLLAATAYFAGEEISWGQHLFGWKTPQWFIDSTGNRQQETNLHNISGWFNQKPRHIFQAWVVLGGILVPLARRWRRRQPLPGRDWSYWFWPTSACSWIAVLVILVRTPEWLVEGLGVQAADPAYFWLTSAPAAEMQEYCMAMFLLLYFWSLAHRARQICQLDPAASFLDSGSARGTT